MHPQTPRVHHSRSRLPFDPGALSQTPSRFAFSSDLSPSRSPAVHVSQALSRAGGQGVDDWLQALYRVRSGTRTPSAQTPPSIPHRPAKRAKRQPDRGVRPLAPLRPICTDSAGIHRIDQLLRDYISNPRTHHDGREAPRRRTWHTPTRVLTLVARSRNGRGTPVPTPRRAPRAAFYERTSKNVPDCPDCLFLPPARQKYPRTAPPRRLGR